MTTVYRLRQVKSVGWVGWIVGPVIKVFFVVAFLSLFLPPASADGSGITNEYDVTGTLTITGNNACSPLTACAETLDFSFVMGSTYDPGGIAGAPFLFAIVPGSATVESLGPLGDFYLGVSDSPIFTFMCEGDCNYFAFYDSQGDEIDVNVGTAASGAPIVPSLVNSFLYGCGTETCVGDFSPDGYQNKGLRVWGEVEATATAVPEPSIVLLLACGLIALGLIRSRREKKA